MATNLLRIRATRLRRWLPLLFYGAAVLASLLAAILPARGPVLNELILVRDVSASVLRADAGGLPAHVRQLMAEADRVHTVWVAGSAWVATDLDQDADRLPVLYGDLPQGSNLAAGLRRAMSIPRSGRVRRRIILLSDGLETEGDAAAAAREAAAVSLIEAVPVGAVPGPDARALCLEGPASASIGEVVDMALLAESDEPIEARVRLRDDRGRVLDQSTHMLSPAGVRIPFSVRIPEGGSHLLSAEVSASGDIVPENDTACLRLLARGPRSLLWLGQPPPAWVQGLGLAVETAQAEAISRGGLRSHSCLVLDNLPQAGLPAGARRLLANAVQQGMGLVVFGGSQSLGKGGYDQPVADDIPIETVLPARMQPRASLALVMALDVSGSMGEPVVAAASRVSKLSLAVTAMLRAWARLADGDQAGLLAFARETRAVLPVARVVVGKDDSVDLSGPRQALLGQRPAGGTRVVAALLAGLDMLESVRAPRRGILLVTDGDSEERGEERERALAEVERRVAGRGIAISVITVGSAPDQETLEALREGSGAQIVAASERMVQLPQILAGEIGRARAYDRSAGRVAVVGAHPANRGLAPAALPQVAAWVAMGPEKGSRGASLLLATAAGEPLAAAWQYGLGRTAVLTGAPWREWGWHDQALLARFPGQLLQWCAQTGHEQAAVQARIAGAVLRLSFTAAGVMPEYGPVPACVAEVMPLPPPAGSGGESEPAPLRMALYPTAPSCWQADGPVPQPGDYRVDIRIKGELIASAPLRVDNRAEWLRFGARGSLLARIALSGNGDVIAAYSRFSPWQRIPVSGHDQSLPVSPLLLAGAAIFMLCGLLASALK